ncbi:hypothetical protein CEXT_662421 [Caerostris extrusa]|uniref:Uncharacterized protein n=1 Tax=Caerostris extrusa TaxID=172846 RepID=A0AAV4TN28_CAEEX|nr:hypothetical protein CEXT_662421 [Caerostris extrusa]
MMSFSFTEIQGRESLCKTEQIITIFSSPPPSTLMLADFAGQVAGTAAFHVTTATIRGHSLYLIVPGPHAAADKLASKIISV